MDLVFIQIWKPKSREKAGNLHAKRSGLAADRLPKNSRNTTGNVKLIAYTGSSFAGGDFADIASTDGKGGN